MTERKSYRELLAQIRHDQQTGSTADCNSCGGRSYVSAAQWADWVTAWLEGSKGWRGVLCAHCKEPLELPEPFVVGHRQSGGGHVCGLEGYNGMIDPPCPACAEAVPPPAGLPSREEAP